MKQKKYTSIEIDENFEDTVIENVYDNNGLSKIEIKNKKFPLDGKIEKQVLYNGKLFKEDRRQSSNYPDIINYRCKNYRNKECNLKTNFWNPILKRKKGKSYFYYNLGKTHSKSCQELVEMTKKI